MHFCLLVSLCLHSLCTLKTIKSNHNVVCNVICGEYTSMHGDTRVSYDTECVCVLWWDAYFNFTVLQLSHAAILRDLLYFKAFSNCYRFVALEAYKLHSINYVGMYVLNDTATL